MLLIVGSIIAITYYAYTANRRDALALTQDVLESLDQRVVTQVQSYLTPAIRVLNLARWVLADGVFTPQQSALAERLATEILRNVPQLASLYFADSDGRFLMVQRTAAGGIDTKTIQQQAGERQVKWVRRDTSGKIVAVEDDPADTYDPRSRPWFQAAVKSAGVHWTDVYVFFTNRKPGITASTQIGGTGNGQPEIVGVDIRLDALSEFLAGLKIGRSGRAMIVDASGRLVAFPEPERMMRQEGQSLVPARLDEIGDPLLTHAFDRLRVLGPGHHVMEFDDQHYVIAETPIGDVVGRDWSLLFVVPENDFVGFVAANNRTTLLMSLAVVALAVALAALLAVQGLHADRDARRLRRRQRTLEAQAQAFAGLAGSTALFDADQAEGAAALTQTVAATAHARRVSLWRFGDGGARLTCEDCWDGETRGHTAGAEFVAQDCPQLFAALLQGDEINVADAALDPRTTDLHRIYLQPVGCRALLAMPIRRHGGIVGSIWVEDGETLGNQQGDVLSFVRAVAGMLSARFAVPAETTETPSRMRAIAGADAADEPAGAVAPPAAGGRTAGLGSAVSQAAMRTASVSGERSNRFAARLAARGLAGEATVATLFPDTTVLVLRFLDPVAIAERSAETGEPVIDRIVRELQRITGEHEIDYVKILSDQIVVVEGFSGDAERQAVAILETALAIRDYCALSFAGLDDSLGFSIGIDTGTAIGSAVGFGGFAYNVWGEALRVASAMAASAPAGTIQVTESTYRYAADRFLFRNRGAFYLERVGELSTYVLKGRL